MKKLQKGEVYSMLKLLFVLIFSIIIITGIYSIFNSLFIKSDANDLIATLKTINSEGKKMVENGKVVGLNNYQDKIKGLAFGQAKVGNLFVTYSGTTIFSGNFYKGANMDGFGDIVENSLLSDDKAILNLVFVGSGDTTPTSLGMFQLNGNSYGDYESAGFGVNSYFAIFKEKNVIVDELVNSNPNIFEKLENIYIYNEQSKKFDIKISGIKLKI